MEIDTVLHVGPERPFVYAEPVHGDHRSAPDADHIEDQRQQWQGNEAGPQTRRDDVLQRIDANHLQARQLLGGFHVADLGRQCGACATGEQQCGDHRAEFAQQRQRHHLPDRLLGAIAAEDVVALQRQHHADENTGHDDDRQRQHADRVQLLDQQRKAVAQAAAAKQCMNEEDRRAPQRRQHIQAGTPEQGDPVHQRTLTHRRLRAGHRRRLAPESGRAPGRPPSLS